MISRDMTMHNGWVGSAAGVQVAKASGSQVAARGNNGAV